MSKNKKQSQSFRTQLISGNTEQTFKRKVHSLLNASVNKNSQNTEGLRWEWYMNFVKYYANIIEFVGEGAELLNKSRPFLAKQLFWNGKVGVRKFENKIGVYSIGQKAKVGIDGFISSANNCLSVFDDKDKVDIIKGKSGTFVQTDIYGWPWILNLDVYIDPILDAWNLLTPELQNSLTKLIVFQSDGNMINDEFSEKIANLFETTNGLIKIFNGKPLETQKLDTNSMNETLHNHIKHLINFMYKLRGRETNISEKSAGVNQSEVDTNKEQFEIVKNDMLNFWNDFIEGYNESYGTSITVRIKSFEKEGVDDESDSKEQRKNTDPKTMR